MNLYFFKSYGGMGAEPPSKIFLAGLVLSRIVGWAKRSVPNKMPGSVGRAPLCPTANPVQFSESLD